MPRQEQGPYNATFASARQFAREPRASEGSAVWSALVRARRGSIAVWIAVMTPVLLIAVSMGVEVGSWAAASVSMQRSVDLAATAGVQGRPQTTPLTATQAGNLAARFAQMNGGAGTSSLSWSGSCSTSCTSRCVQTGSDNQITVQVIYCGGLQNASDPMINVSMSKSMASYLSSPLFNGSSSHTITVSGTAEVVTTTSAPLPGSAAATQPCLLALSTSGQIAGTGSNTISMPGCSMRSNGTITFTGGGNLQTAGFFAPSNPNFCSSPTTGGSVCIQTWITTTGTQYNNAGTISDPFASDTALQNALTATANLTGVSDISCGTTGGVYGTAGQWTGNNNCNGTNTLPNGGTCVTGSGVTCTMYPGNYGSWYVPSGGPYTFNLQPGLYQFNGDITLTQNTTTNATGGVTILTAGAGTLGQFE